jgi:hypothetical protein
VATILLDNMGAEQGIILHQQGERLWHINNRQLHFPLLLPHGELRLYLAVQKGDTKKTTQFNP